MTSKRQQLIDTAERLFYRDGYYATGIDRVIAEAGVARMTLYNHFSSKEDLVCAALEQRSQSYLRFLDDILAKAENVPGALAHALVSAHAQWLSSIGDRGCMFMKAIGEYREHSPRITEFARGHKAEVIDRIRSRVDLADEDDCRHYAESLMLILEGLTAMAQIQPIEVATGNVRQLIDAWLSREFHDKSRHCGG